MFNPKGNNLINQQLAVSGLHSNILGFLDGGAGQRNDQREKAYKEHRKHEKKVAELSNAHNKELDAAEEFNYKQDVKFTFDQQERSWKRGVDLQDFSRYNQLKEFEKSLTITNEQLGLNAAGMAQALDEEHATVQEAFIQNQFEQKNNLSALKEAYYQNNFARQEQGLQLAGIKSRERVGTQSIQNNIDQFKTQSALAKETAMIESLMAEGTAQLGQAGKSTAKAAQANMAKMQRGLMALDLELSGKYKQAAVQLSELQAESSLAEMGVGLNIAKLDNAIMQAEDEAAANQEMMRYNMKSFIEQSQRNINQIALDRKYADINTKANMMLYPEDMGYDPEPQMPPERKFVPRMKVLPGFVQPPVSESRTAGVLNTFSQIASIATPFVKP